MNLVVIVLLSVMTSSVISLSDKEIDDIKVLVDKELATREVELLKQKKSHTKSISSDRNEIVHPLGGLKTAKKPKLSTNRPRKVKTTFHPDTHLQESIDNCIDMIESDVCQKAIDDGGDCNQHHMEIYCEKSCGYCGVPSYPVDCSKSKFGCCDDMLTPKSDPFGTKCPACEDNVPELCQPHFNDCNEVGMVGNWMRTNCKKTCGVCTSINKATPKPVVCKDDKENGKFCDSWNNAGLCDVLQDMMKNYCRKTCGFCDTKVELLKTT